MRDRHLRRRRRHVAVVLATRREHHPERACHGATDQTRTPTRQPTNHHGVPSTPRLSKHRRAAHGRRDALREPRAAEGTILRLRSLGKKAADKTQPAPEGAGCPLPPYSTTQELALSTVTARRFCDQQEMSLHTAT